MDFAKYSFYDKLTDKEREFFLASLRRRSFGAGQDVYRGDCTGLIFTEKGRLCAYTLSAEGREITLYRLTEEDVCLFSASCALENTDFDVFVRAETDTDKSHTEGFVDFALTIEGVEVSVAVLEVKRGQYKISLRSKRANVNAVASEFGGGGHVLASGCMLFGEYEEVIDRLSYAVSKQL